MARFESVELTVAGDAIHCSACEHRIEALLGTLPGVEKVMADHRSQQIVLALDTEKTSLEEVEARLNFLGYPLASPRSTRSASRECG